MGTLVLLERLFIQEKGKYESISFGKDAVRHTYLIESKLNGTASQQTYSGLYFQWTGHNPTYTQERLHSLKSVGLSIA